jgi:four helix bundle protein
MNITRFEDIESWKAARAVTNRIYRETRNPRFDDDRGLRSQRRRASASIMSDIAERFDCGSDLEFRRYLRISRKSTNEVLSHLHVASDQEYTTQAVFKALYNDASTIRRLISGFIKYLGGSRRVTGDR